VLGVVAAMNPAGEVVEAVGGTLSLVIITAVVVLHARGHLQHRALSPNVAR
jgi:hypothetical protein